MAEKGRPSDYIEIYELLDPRDGSLRYIGKANDAEARLAGHIRDSRRRKTPVYAWVRKLASLGVRPLLNVVAVSCADEWKAIEQRLIAEARARGERLLNVADGGDEPFCPRETRAQNGRRNARAIHHGDPLRRRVWELNRFIGAAVRDGTLTERNRKKIRLAAQRAPHFFGRWASI